MSCPDSDHHDPTWPDGDQLGPAAGPKTDHSMSQKLKIAILCCLVAFAGYAVLTGGIAAENVSDFGGQRDLHLTRGLASDIWLQPKSSRIDIPFVFHYYSAEGPFDIRLQIWDESRQFRAIRVTEVVVEYPDGEVVRSSADWAKELKPYTQYNSSSAGIIKTPMRMLSEELKGFVLRHVDVKITLKGHLSKASDERVEFVASESFRAESRTRLETFWNVIANR